MGNAKDDSSRLLMTWTAEEMPQNVSMGARSVVTGQFAFKRLSSKLDPALVIGADSTMDGVQFGIGESGFVEIGDYCYFNCAVLLCEAALHIGNYVTIGWNATIADTDFHPISPAERVRDAVACSPLGKGMRRPPIAKRPVIIEDDVMIGPGATILKGVRLGAGSFVEAGAVVTKDVPPGARVIGNPACISTRE